MIEQLRQKASGLFGSEADRGVSPVIGVILMVAITVILAAVIGAFVLGLGGDMNQEAQGAATFSEDDGTVTAQVTSLSGADTMKFNVPETTDGTVAVNGETGASPTGLSVGDTVKITGLSDGDTVTAIAVLEEGDVETTVGSHTFGE